MKVREVYNVLPVRLFASAITIYPFIFYARSKSKTQQWLRRHEWEHIAQIRELGFFYFYFDYIKQYLSNRINGQCHGDAYRGISYEIKAHKVESDGRRPWLSEGKKS